MKHKIAFIDMDGTLYQTENDIIQESTLAAIDQLRQAGYKIVAATGRPLNQMKLIMDRVEFDYYVLINGGYILDRDLNEINAFPIVQRTVNDLVQLAKDNEYGLMFHFGDATYIYNDFYPMYYFSKYANVLDSLFYDPPHSFHKRHRVFNAVILTKDPAGLDAFMEAHPNLRSDLINIKTEGIAYDIFNSATDKAEGIQAVLDYEGLDWEDAIAFGDSTNDTQMLEKAGIGVAMGSATDYVKSFADIETTDVYHDGIYNAVKQILAQEAGE